MKRSIFLLVAGILMIFNGIMYALMPEQMIGQLGHEATPIAKDFAFSIGLLLTVVGLINVLARKSEDTLGLKAILTGTLILFTVGVIHDVYNISQEFYSSAAWGQVFVRLIFAVAYAAMLTVTLRTIKDTHLRHEIKHQHPKKH